MHERGFPTIAINSKSDSACTCSSSSLEWEIIHKKGLGISSITERTDQKRPGKTVKFHLTEAVVILLHQLNYG